MANPDWEFTEGFDKYGPVGVLAPEDIMIGEWTSITADSGTASVNKGVTIGPSLIGAGNCLRLSYSGNNGGLKMRKNMPANYARTIGGFYIKWNAGSKPHGINFLDAGTIQGGFRINGSTGTFSVIRGEVIGGTVLETSIQGLTNGGIHCIEYDIIWHNSTGRMKIWIDGVLTSINGTVNYDLCQTANNFVNMFELRNVWSNTIDVTDWDHFFVWAYTASGGSETPPLTNSIIETQLPISDDTSDFAPGAGVVGKAYKLTANTTTFNETTHMVRVVPEVNCDLNSLSVMPRTTNAGFRMKAVIYSEVAGSPSALLATGTEVVGSVSGTLAVLPFAAPYALVAGTAYWIGIFKDVGGVFDMFETASGGGYYKSPTYASGPLNPMVTPTVSVPIALYGNVSGIATNWPYVNDIPPVGDKSYVQSDVVNAIDLFGFAPMAINPTAIYTVALKAQFARSDAGARTIEFQMKSGGVSSAGSGGAIVPLVTYSWGASYYRTDPNTGAAWLNAALNAAKSGYKIAS